MKPAGLLDPRTRQANVRAELRAWLAIQATLAFRPQEASARLRAAGGKPESVLAGLCGSPSDAHLDRTLQRLAQRALLVLPQTSADFPACLRAIVDPPPLLIVEGRVEALRSPAVAIVGARAATHEGLDIARHLGRALAEQGLTVVSGLARGIDAAAHRGALAGGGSTVAVMACGLDVTYPAEHHALRREIVQQGACISELPLGTPPRPPHFPLRNRLISGLCAAVVIVEARRRSGSLVTVRHALDQGREVLVVPGPLSSPASAGSNALLRDGARPLLDASDVLDALGLDHTPAPPGSARRPLVVGAEARRILAALRHRPRRRDELAAHLGCRPRDIALQLLDLELEGLLREGRDGLLRVASRMG